MATSEYRLPARIPGFSRHAPTVVRHALVIIYAALVLAPIIYMILIALHTTVGVESGDVIPVPLHWATFADMWRAVNLGRFLRNSLVVATVTGLLAAPLAMGAGYVIARFNFRGRNGLLVGLLSTHLFPNILLLLPLYVIIVLVQQAIRVTLVGSYFGVIVTYMSFSLPFAIWLMYNYIARLPREVEEAALIDGATGLQMMRHVLLPMALPGLSVAFIFSFLLGWNDVLFASVMTDQSTETLGVGLQAFVAEGLAVPQWNDLMAGSLVSAVPAVILFMVVQRWIVTGLTGGSVKE